MQTDVVHCVVGWMVRIQSMSVWPLRGHGDRGDPTGHDQQVDVVQIIDALLCLDSDLAAIADRTGVFGDEENS